MQASDLATTAIQKKSPATDSRHVGIELLRILAMLMVVTLHFLGHGGILKASAPGSVQFAAAWALETFCYVAVNCYVLISGYFLVTSQFKLKKLVILWLQVAVFSAGIYAAFVILGRAPLTLDNLFLNLLPIVMRRYWFASIYIALYLLFPFLNKAIHAISKTQLRLLLIVLLLFSCAWRSLWPLLGDFNPGGGTNIPWFICLYVTAAYLRLYGKQRIGKYRYLAGYLCCCAVLLCTRLLGHGGAGTELHYSYHSIFVYLASVCLFLFFTHVGIRSRIAARTILFVAPLTFGVYLISDNPYVRDILYTSVWHVSRYFSSPQLWPMLIVWILATFCICAAVEYLRKRIFRPLEQSRWLDRLCIRISTYKFFTEKSSVPGMEQPGEGKDNG